MTVGELGEIDNLGIRLLGFVNQLAELGVGGGFSLILPSTLIMDIVLDFRVLRQEPLVLRRRFLACQNILNTLSNGLFRAFRSLGRLFYRRRGDGRGCSRRFGCFRSVLFNSGCRGGHRSNGLLYSGFRGLCSPSSWRLWNRHTTILVSYVLKIPPYSRMLVCSGGLGLHTGLGILIRLVVSPPFLDRLGLGYFKGLSSKIRLNNGLSYGHSTLRAFITLQGFNPEPASCLGSFLKLGGIIGYFHSLLAINISSGGCNESLIGHIAYLCTSVFGGIEGVTMQLSGKYLTILSLDSSRLDGFGLRLLCRSSLINGIHILHANALRSNLGLD